jgi:hypothetical protein
MTGISAYKFRPAPVRAKYSKSHGGFKAKTKELIPMAGPGEFLGDWMLSDILDNLTLACEAGKLDSEKWVSQLFQTTEDFDSFLEHLEAYDDMYAIYDRWHRALMEIGNSEMEGFTGPLTLPLACAIGLSKQVSAE